MINVTEDEANLITGALDSLGVALADHGHEWTEGERCIYEAAVECVLKASNMNARQPPFHLRPKGIMVRCMDWLGEWTDVPENVTKCPECGSQLQAWVDGWSEDKGYSVDVNCKAEDGLEENHRYFQCDWQPVMDVVKAWANG